MKIVTLVLALVGLAKAQDYTFPEGFKFGVATASYQVEGAWDVNGKGENIWDHLTHNQPELIVDGSTGDVACDAYYKTSEDVQLMKNMGVNFYRFSISWSRILPSGHSNVINDDGIRYYNELIDELLANDITPMVTMYHWDLPQPLQEIGGWPNPLLADIFADYADVLFSKFGDRVRDWITFNEPGQICEAGYAEAGKAPAYNQLGVGGYLCGHTLLLAHAKAYRLYEEEYKDTQNGKIGISIDAGWYEPNDETSAEDIEAAERAFLMNHGWYIHPIFSTTGDYPAILRERVNFMSEEEGFSRSRLPYFTEAEIDLIRGTGDFLGLNHYTSHICTYVTDGSTFPRPSHYADVGVVCHQDENWESAASTWLKVYPVGLRKLLNYVKDNYGNPEVVITESGFSDGEVVLQDCRRINYYNLYLTELLNAIHIDDCNVSGYTAWSFMDNFEWLMGYTERFGLHSVDFDDPDRPRIPKMSSYIYKNIIETRAIDWGYAPAEFESCEW